MTVRVVRYCLKNKQTHTQRREPLCWCTPPKTRAWEAVSSLFMKDSQGYTETPCLVSNKEQHPTPLTHTNKNQKEKEHGCFLLCLLPVTDPQEASKPPFLASYREHLCLAQPSSVLFSIFVRLLVCSVIPSV